MQKFPNFGNKVELGYGQKTFIITISIGYFYLVKRNWWNCAKYSSVKLLSFCRLKKRSKAKRIKQILIFPQQFWLCAVQTKYGRQEYVISRSELCYFRRHFQKATPFYYINHFFLYSQNVATFWCCRLKLCDLKQTSDPNVPRRLRAFSLDSVLPGSNIFSYIKLGRFVHSKNVVTD